MKADDPGCRVANVAVAQEGVARGEYEILEILEPGMP